MAEGLVDTLKLQYLETVGSTQDFAKTCVQKGEAQGGECFWTLNQTTGYGRRGRAWLGSKGNLFFSFIWSLDEDFCGKNIFERVSNLSLLLPVCLIQTLEMQFPKNLSFSLKWPNDILLCGQKVAGMILEVVYNNNRPYVILGVGVNFVQIPQGVSYKATHIFSAIERPEGFSLENVMQVFSDVWIRQERLLNKTGLGNTLKVWEKKGPKINTSIIVRFANGDSFKGTYNGMDEAGALKLMDERKSLHLIRTGEVYLQK